MIKHKEISDPQSCLNKADDDEILFVVRSKDKAMAATIAFWCEERKRLGLDTDDSPKFVGAQDLIKQTLQYQSERQKEENKQWLSKMAEKEDQVGGNVSVGGLACDAGLHNHSLSRLSDNDLIAALEWHGCHEALSAVRKIIAVEKEREKNEKV